MRGAATPEVASGKRSEMIGELEPRHSPGRASFRDPASDRPGAWTRGSSSNDARAPFARGAASSAEHDGEREAGFARFLVLAVHVFRRLGQRRYGGVQIDAV